MFERPNKALWPGHVWTEPGSLISKCRVRLILETDPSTIASRVAMRGADTDVPLTEQACTPVCMHPMTTACLISLLGKQGTTPVRALAAPQPDVLQGAGNRQGADCALASEVTAFGAAGLR